jgi:phage terminase large subunit-like protein
MNASLAELLSLRPESERQAFLSSLPTDEAAALEHYWPFWARPAQLAPSGSWRTWLILAGRGFGKTRTGAEWVRESVKTYPLVNMIAATADDARDIMIEGESGILAICPETERPEYQASKRRLEWPNGARSLIFTADEPERLRGKQHMRLWADELASWRYPESWDQAMFGLRLGADPRAVVTTTPKPTEIIQRLLKDPDVAVTRGSTYDNRANLAPAFFQQIITRYEGTRLGRQELNAELLLDVPGALFMRDDIEHYRTVRPPQQQRIVVGVDPSGGANAQGIVVAGVGVDGRGYCFDDRTVTTTPEGWGRAVVAAYHAYHANYVVAEVNYGGDMVTHVISTIDPRVPVKLVRASRGKAQRAEPVAALMSQGRISHVGQRLSALEEELCTWEPGVSTWSPNRLDAYVWAFTELLVEGGQPFATAVAGRREAVERYRPR